MSSGMPELGSKISLISKADIRYEGRLFTVDPQECTIALATVRSFGTEDRETQYPVPAQSQVYDYILFRGSDIKDIRVINNVSSLPNDPAIMQLSVPPSLGQQQYQPQGFSHPVIGSMGPPLSHFNTNYMGGLAPGMGLGGSQMGRGLGNKQSSEFIMPGSVPVPDLTPVQVDPIRANEQHASVLDLIGGGSRSATPASMASRKSPTADQAVQVSAGAKKDDKRVQRPIKPPFGPQRDNRQMSNPRGENMPQNPVMDQQRSHNFQNQITRNPAPQFTQHRQQSWAPMARGLSRARGMRPHGQQMGNIGYNNYRQNQQTHQPPPNSKPKSTLKFENDYDFEEANTQFEELRTQLEKVKIKDAKPEVNGESEKKDDSGNETGAGECEQEDEDQIFYDKAKSFFDNISCEAVERSKGRSQRTDWRVERKLNSETFGVSSTRRTGYRGGRGGFYNRGGYRPNYNRGGYRPQTNQNTRRTYTSNTPQSQESTQAGSSASIKPPASIPIPNGSINKPSK